MVTTGVDILWLLFWIPFYHDTEMAKWNYGLHMFVVATSILEVALKVIIFLMLFKANANNSSDAFAEQMNNKYQNLNSQNSNQSQGNKRQPNIQMQELM